MLIQHFIERFNRELGRSVQSVPRPVLRDLLARPWPGNVRELQNTIQRLMVLSTGRELAAPAEASRPAPAVQPSDEEVPPETFSIPALQPLEEVERAARRIRGM